MDYKRNMPNKPKRKLDIENTGKPAPVVKPEIVKKSSWEQDQRERGYYYDDTCNYETYDPEQDVDDEIAE